MTTIDKLPIHEKMAAVLEDTARRLRTGVTDQGLLDSAAMELEEKARELRAPLRGAEAEAELLREALIEAGQLDAKALDIIRGMVTTIARKDACIEQLEATVRLLSGEKT